MYSFSAAGEAARPSCEAQLFGSGAILNEVLRRRKLLEKYGVAADVWSVTSYNELYRDGHACERWNMLHPGETPRVPYVTQCLKDAPGVLVAASDYLKVAAGHDRPLDAAAACARSAPTASAAARTAPTLREFFEVDARFVALATLAELAQDGAGRSRRWWRRRSRTSEIDPEKKPTRRPRLNQDAPRLHAY